MRDAFGILLAVVDSPLSRARLPGDAFARENFDMAHGSGESTTTGLSCKAVQKLSGSCLLRLSLEHYQKVTCLLRSLAFALRIAKASCFSRPSSTIFCACSSKDT